MRGLLSLIHRQLQIPLLSLVADAACRTLYLQNNNGTQIAASAHGTYIATRRLLHRSQKASRLLDEKEALVTALLRWKNASPEDRKDVIEGAMLLKDIASHMYTLALGVLGRSLPHSTLVCREIVIQVLQNVLDAANVQLVQVPMRQFQNALASVQQHRKKHQAKKAEKRTKEFERWGVIEPSALAYR